MADLKKEYSNDEITVVWKPSICIHSEKCAKGLSTVFQPQSKPWINMPGAASQEIVNQVKECPSGALSFYYNDGRKEEATGDSIKILIKNNGPLLVHGTCEVEAADGTKEIRENTTAFCRCGSSQNKPYCDGTHRKIEFEG